MAAVHIVGRCTYPHVDVAQFRVDAEGRPHVRVAAVFPGAILPRLGADLAEPRNGIERPLPLARPDVERPDIGPRALLPRESIGHRPTEDHDVADDGRRPAPTVDVVADRRRRHVSLQVDAPAGPEGRIRFAGLRIERGQVVAMLDQNARVGTVRPVRDAARADADIRVRPGLGRLLDPDCLPRAGVEGLDEPDGVRRVEHAVDHQGCRAKVIGVAQVRHFGQDRGIHRWAPPRDPQPGHVGFVDLVERRVFRGAEAATVCAPLTICRVALREGGNRREQYKGHDHQRPNMLNALVHRPVLLAHCMQTAFSHFVSSRRSTAPGFSSVSTYTSPSGPWRTSRIRCLRSSR